MPLFKKLATLATAAEAARRYAKKNPDKAARYVDQAAQFVDKQTKGKYSGQISGAASKAKNVAGIRTTPTTGPIGNGHSDGYGSTPTYPRPQAGTSQYGSTQYGSTPPGSTPPGTTPPGTTPPVTPPKH